MMQCLLGGVRGGARCVGRVGAHTVQYRMYAKKGGEAVVEESSSEGVEEGGAAAPVKRGGHSSVLKQLEEQKMMQLSKRLAVVNSYATGLVSKEEVFKLSDANEYKGIIEHINVPKKFAKLISAKTFDKIYSLYKENPKEYSIRKLAAMFGLSQQKICGILMSRHLIATNPDSVFTISREQLVSGLEEPSAPAKPAKAETEESEEQVATTEDEELEEDEFAKELEEEQEMKGRGRGRDRNAVQPFEIPLIEGTDNVDIEKFFDQYLRAVDIEPNFNVVLHPKTNAGKFGSTWSFEEDEFDEEVFAQKSYEAWYRKKMLNLVPDTPPPHLMQWLNSVPLCGPKVSQESAYKLLKKTPLYGGRMIIINSQAGRRHADREIYIREVDGSARTASWEERRTILNPKPQKNMVQQTIEALYPDPNKPKPTLTPREIKLYTFR